MVTRVAAACTLNSLIRQQWLSATVLKYLPPFVLDYTIIIIIIFLLKIEESIKEFCVRAFREWMKAIRRISYGRIFDLSNV